MENDKTISWRPSYQEFQDLFSNDNALRILAVLTPGKELYCAADIAKLLDVHVSTAKKYLDLLHDHGFIDKQQFDNKPGKPTYFYPKSSRLTITLDLPAIAAAIAAKFDESALPDPAIREHPEASSKASYSFSSKGLVEEITVKKQTKARRTVKQKIMLNGLESQFMKYLPHPTMDFQPFLLVCKKAGITDYFEMKSLVNFVDKLKRMDIIATEEDLKRQDTGK